MPIRTILAIILSMVLSGCASYPYTVIDDGQGMYYEDPVDVFGGDAYATYGYASYSDMRYYPFWSLDYFYLNAWYEPRFGYYSPYFYPYHFSIWYSPWYWGPDYRWGRYTAWADPYWRYRYRHHHHDRPVYLSEEPGSPGYTTPPLVTGPASRSEIRENREPGIRRTSINAPVSGGSGAMTVISPSERKVGPSRVGPGRDRRIDATVRPSSPGAVVAPQRSAPAGPVSGSRPTAPQRPAYPSAGSSGQRTGPVDRSPSSASSRERHRD
jgi:hypothetical protein